MNWYLSILPAPGSCSHENSKPIETREGGWSKPSSQPVFSDCLPSLENRSCTLICLLISFKSQIPSFATLTWLCKNWNEWSDSGGKEPVLGSATLRCEGLAAEQSWQERKIVKAEREKVGGRTGEKFWGLGVGVTWEGRGIPCRAATSADTIFCFA